MVNINVDVTILSIRGSNNIFKLMQFQWALQNYYINCNIYNRNLQNFRENIINNNRKNPLKFIDGILYSQYMWIVKSKSLFSDYESGVSVVVVDDKHENGSHKQTFTSCKTNAILSICQLHLCYLTVGQCSFFCLVSICYLLDTSHYLCYNK